MDRKAMYKLSYGLFILTAKEAEKDNGCIINTAIQAASEPNQLSICVNKANYTHGTSSDTELFKNHRSTIRFQGHRIATCLYRTPMGSCIEKTVAFYIPHNLKIIKYAQRSLLPSPGANGRCFFCLQRKEASVKWQFFG